MGYVIGVDIGGTFTDCVVIAPATAVGDGASGSRLTLGKAPSTPPDFHDGFIDALRTAAARAGVSLERLIAEADGLYHGCTVGTNALVEQRTARVGLLTTRGHRDTLFAMQAGGRLKHLPPEQIARVALHAKPDPLVPKELCAELDERIAFDGRVLVELDEDGARAEIRRLLDAGAEAFAISLLWSPVNDVHERRVRALVAELAPDAFVSCAAQVIPRTGEYERTVATVVNALIGPEMERYLVRLEQELATLGWERPLQIMTCTGGVIDAAAARATPVLTIGSGPVAGLIGAGALARRAGAAGDANVITGDLGGTSFDVGVVSRGTPLQRATSSYGQYEYFVPTLDVRSVGTGGGSVVRYDAAAQTLKVGPQSAGARPGPVCYRRGGEQPTVSDANLVLGYLNPDFFLGGGIALDVEAARAALAAAGAPLGFDAVQTAAAAVRIADSAMADAIRLASVQQGYDPRDFAFYAIGGGGPLHATAVARELGIGRVVVPLSDVASGWSAFGIASSDVVVVKELSVGLKHPFEPEQLNAHWDALEREVAAAMARQGVPAASATLRRTADMGYGMQVNQVEVPAPDGTYDAAAVARLVADFEREYERVYGEGSGYAAAGYMLTGLRVRGSAALAGFELAAPAAGAAGAPPLKGERDVVFYEAGLTPRRTPVLDGAALRPGMRAAGPAVLEYPDTTVLLRDGDVATVDALGSLEIAIGGSAR